MQKFNDMIHTTLIAGYDLPHPPDNVSRQSLVLGVLTLEDIIERTLRVDIIDETERDKKSPTQLLPRVPSGVSLLDGVYKTKLQFED